MTEVRLARVNLVRLRFPLEAPKTREFVAAVDRLNRPAEQSAAEDDRDPGRSTAMVPIAVLLVVATWDAMRGRMRAVEPSPP
jgi:hypothetical protein